MTETEPSQPGVGQQAGALAFDSPAAGDPLSAALLRAQRLLCSIDVEPDVRLRLQLRYAAICASLKVPAANRLRGAERLERLIADVTAADRWQRAAGESGRESVQ